MTKQPPVTIHNARPKLVHGATVPGKGPFQFLPGLNSLTAEEWALQKANPMIQNWLISGALQEVQSDTVLTSYQKEPPPAPDPDAPAKSDLRGLDLSSAIKAIEKQEDSKQITAWLDAEEKGDKRPVVLASLRARAQGLTDGGRKQPPHTKTPEQLQADAEAKAIADAEAKAIADADAKAAADASAPHTKSKK